jgi:hypothetical protein
LTDQHSWIDGMFHSIMQTAATGVHDLLSDDAATAVT